MKFILEKGHFKTTKHLFIGTGLFLISLFSYQLFRDLHGRSFIKEFPGDWDKIIGIMIGLYLIFRSLKFRIQSRDLFIKTTPELIKFRIDREADVHVIKKSKLQSISIKKGRIEILFKNSSDKTIIDLNQFRLRETYRKEIVDFFNQYL